MGWLAKVYIDNGFLIYDESGIWKPSSSDLSAQAKEANKITNPPFHYSSPADGQPGSFVAHIVKRKLGGSRIELAKFPVDPPGTIY